MAPAMWTTRGASGVYVAAMLFTMCVVHDTETRNTRSRAPVLNIGEGREKSSFPPSLLLLACDVFTMHAAAMFYDARCNASVYWWNSIIVTTLKRHRYSLPSTFHRLSLPPSLLLHISIMTHNAIFRSRHTVLFLQQPCCAKRFCWNTL